MKMDGDEKRKYFFMGLTFFLSACAVILFLMLLMHLGEVSEELDKLLKILTPIIDGLVLTYILAPIVNSIENKWIYAKFSARIFKGREEGEKRGRAKRKVRSVSIFITFVIFMLIMVGFFAIIIPGIAESIQKISKNLPVYQWNLTVWVDKMLVKYPALDDAYNNLMNNFSDPINEWINTNVFGKVNEFAGVVLSGGISLIKSLFNFIIGMIISLYLLGSKELMIGQAKKIAYALMKKDTANAFIYNVRYTNKIFQDFFVGKILDSIVIGLLCFIATTILRTPYALLISIIIGVTNIIPFFGPFIGAIPSAILVLLVDPKQCLYFVILIIVLQQLDGNVIGPLILGQKTGLSGFWVIFAITLFGGLFGFPGMLLGVPIFAVIYTGVSSFIRAKLKEKGLKDNTKQYVHVDYINEDGEYVRLPKEDIKGVMSGKDFKAFFTHKKKAENPEEDKKKGD